MAYQAILKIIKIKYIQMKNEDINNLKVNYEVVKNDLEISRQLVTHKGFYNYWFEQLKLPENKNKSYSKVFDEVNQLYIKIFKTKKGRYSSYRSFQTIAARLRKLKNN